MLLGILKDLKSGLQMKVKELVEKLLQFDQELEVVMRWNEPYCLLEADLAFTDTVTTCLAVEAKWKGFYKRVDDELGNPIYPDVKAKEFVVIT